MTQSRPVIFDRLLFRVEKEEDEVFQETKSLKEGRRPVYIYLLLLSGYILYLTLGGIRALRTKNQSFSADLQVHQGMSLNKAFIFTWIEEPAEIHRCESARTELKEKIFKAGDDYFYDMGLNLKVFPSYNTLNPRNFKFSFQNFDF